LHDRQSDGQPRLLFVATVLRLGQVRGLSLFLGLGLLFTLAATAGAAKLPRGGRPARIQYVIDGDTVVLMNGRHVRLVQIDTPEVHGSPECYGRQASNMTRRLLPPGTAVRLYREPKTDAVDGYGRLLRYVFRARDGLDVNVQLVRAGDAAPYFYDYRRGRYAHLLVRLARHARARHLGLWGRCPLTPWDPDHGVSSGPA
jgi:endonuclease YncB( thermonuclease family)